MEGRALLRLVGGGSLLNEPCYSGLAEVKRRDVSAAAYACRLLTFVSVLVILGLQCSFVKLTTLFF